MKTLLKIIGVLVVILLALLFILPLIYKAEIIRLTKVELNRNVDAEIDFDDINLSLFRSFPDFSLEIESLIVVGNDEFSEDTLLKVKTISLALDIASVVGRDNYEIKRIKLYEPELNVKINKDGKANYDISISENNNNSTHTENEEYGSYGLSIKKFQVLNGKLCYADKGSKTNVYIDGLYHTLSGALDVESVILHTNTRMSNLEVVYEGIPYLSNIAVVYKANIIADIKNEIYTIGKNELILNNLFIGFDGSVSYVNEDLNLVLTFNSKGNEFKELLSLIPAIYSKDFEKITADGTFSVTGNIKGIYNETNIPSFSFTTKIDNGKFQYPNLPKSVNNIFLTSSITNKGGSLDNTIVDVSKFGMELGNVPIVANFQLSTPISDPKIKARITGDFKLSEIKDFYPIHERNELEGDLMLDIKLDGKLSSIENEKYDEFLAMGSMVAKNFTYTTSSLKDPITISNMQLNFSPSYLDLVNFRCLVGKSDLQATGKIEDYLDYFLNSGSLSGNLITKSEYLNIDEIIGEKDEEQKSSEKIANQEKTPHTDTSINYNVEIPKKINFSVQSTFTNLVYDSLEMKNVGGEIVIANQMVNLNNLKMEAVGGLMTIKGSYSTANINHPKVDFNIRMEDMSIPSSYNQFALFRNYIPITNKATGNFSANFNINTLLNNKMMPDYSTLVGKGILKTNKVVISGLNSLSQIANDLNMAQLNNMEIDDFETQFKIDSGTLLVKPTEFSYKNINAELSGKTGLDKSIEYKLELQIPRSEFGNSANKVIDDLISQADILGTNISMPNSIPINIAIGGTIDNPIIKTMLGENIGSSGSNTAKDIIQNELGNEAGIKAQKLIDDANKQASYLIKEAKKKSKKIKENASEALDLLNKETEKQAEALIKEGKKNGFVGEMAAKEAVKQLRNETSKNGANLIEEANKNADKIIKEAEKAADKLKKDARTQADKLRK